MHGEQCHDEGDGTREGHGDGALGARAVRGEGPGEGVHARVEFRVRERGALEDERGRLRGAGRLGPERLGERDVPPRLLGGVPLGEDEGALVLAQDVERRERDVRRGDRLLQERDEALAEECGGARVEEVGAVLDPALDAAALALLHEVEAEVELRGVLADALAPRGEPRQERRLGALAREVHDHHLEERVPGERAGGVQGLHEAFEGEVLVGVGGEVGLADAGEEFGEGRLAGEVRAQHEGVDEEADEVFEGFVRAARDGRAERDVLARAEPVQEAGDGCLRDHEHADAVRAGEGAQGALQVRGDGEADGAAAPARLGGAGPVGGEVQLLGEPGERAGPVVEEGGPGLGEEVPLPQRVVGVTGGQRRPVGGAARGARGVGGGEVGAQGAVRPLVGRDVVEDEEEDV
ncbi:hypothetical protein GA0115252_13011, partial [Streptomyces sp. DfronAA-171]